jgi:hypothetical protein
MKKSTVKLSETDGNIFAVIGACRKAAKAAGWTKPQIEELSRNFTDSRTYDEAVCVAFDNFNVT